MRWNELLADVVTLECADASVDVAGVEYDSRKVGRGDVFVAMRGGVADGNRFVESAIAQGAAGVVTDSREMFERLRLEHADLGASLVERGRRGLAEVSAAFFGHPEKKLKLSAVTGTNGKTTTAFLLEQMLRSVGRKCVCWGRSRRMWGMR